MKAIIISEPGGPEVLQVADRPNPIPAAGEVLIKVAAAGVNRPDVAQRKGSYPPPPGAPQDIPGLEVAGTVEALGNGVIRWHVGDKVCALVSTVYVTAGTDAKCRFCEDLGAVKSINYNTQNFKNEIARLTNGSGVNVILDMIGGNYTPDNLQALTNDGRLVHINSMKGKDVQIDLSIVMRKRLIITGSMLRGRDVDFKSAIARALEMRIWPLLASGEIKPIIHQVFDADDAAMAHELMESSAHTGKIVLRFG